MNLCAECEQFRAADRDFFCERCRQIETLVQDRHFPESDKLADFQKGEGPVIQKFLNWLKAKGWEICHDENDYMYEPVHYHDKWIMQEYAGIDQDALDIELDALYETLKRDAGN
jgi:hypothetical protein